MTIGVRSFADDSRLRAMSEVHVADTVWTDFGRPRHPLEFSSIGPPCSDDS